MLTRERIEELLASREFREKIEDLAGREFWVIDCRLIPVEVLVDAILRVRKQREAGLPENQINSPPNESGKSAP